MPTREMFYYSYYERETRPESGHRRSRSAKSQPTQQPKLQASAPAAPSSLRNEFHTRDNRSTSGHMSKTGPDKAQATKTSAQQQTAPTSTHTNNSISIHFHGHTNRHTSKSYPTTTMDPEPTYHSAHYHASPRYYNNLEKELAATRKQTQLVAEMQAGVRDRDERRSLEVWRRRLGRRAGTLEGEVRGARWSGYY